jgi:two-component system, sensor histidine kinase and response regulator
VAQAILETAGIFVTIANNGEGAVQALQNSPFDAVLMDIQMPIMNGYEATRLIRELPQGKTIPIVAMTAHAMKGDEEKCLEAGMDGYISKPVNQDRLFHTLWRLLRSRRRMADDAMLQDHAGPPAASTEVDGPAPEERLHGSENTAGNRGTLPARLPGIDIGRTLEILDIDGSALRHILVGFLAENRQTLNMIRQAYALSDREQVRQLAHGLKGSAGNIGAVELNMAAHALETACHEADAAQGASPLLDGLIDALESALNRVLESIQSLDAGGPTIVAGPESTGTEQPLEVLLDTLADAIDRADPELILNTLPALKQQAARCGQINAFSLKRLEEQLNRYDYDQALGTIRRISSILRRNT